VGVVSGKRCLGGMLELLTHCHYLVAVNGSQLGMPEVTLPVVPGMEGCHWAFRKARPADWPRLMHLLLSGRPVRADEAVGWLIDYAGPMNDTLATAWALASGGSHRVERRALDDSALKGLPDGTSGIPPAGSPATETARKAILDCVRASCGASLSEALTIQARHSAEFMVSKACRGGRVGTEYSRTMKS